MDRIPLISIENVVRVARLLEAHGVRPDRYLERARLSPSVCDTPGGFVPGHSVWAFADAADHGETLGDLWLDVARVTGWRGAEWVAPLTRAPDAMTVLTAIGAE